jgi:hypothetical protein
MGTASIYGSQVTPYTTLAAYAHAGDTTVQLSQAPVGWKAGDTLLLPGTSASANQDEQVAIASISGTTVTLASRLAFDHTAPQAGLPVYVANEARNVVLQSQNAADKTRHGHVMFMHTDQETVAYAAFLSLGRTDKSVPLNNVQLDANGNVIPGTGTNQVGRYALHFHRDYWPSLSGSDPAVLVLGNYESGSPGWGYDNHSSNIDFEQNVAFDNFGAGFATEAGNEIGTFNANLAVRTIGVPNGASGVVIQSRSAINDFGFNGAGFWMQSPGCTLNNNVAVDNQVGFNYYNQALTEAGLGEIQFWSANAADGSAYGTPLVSTMAVQIPQFFGNIAAEATEGLQLFWHMPLNMPVPAGVHSVIDTFTAWDVTDGVSAVTYTARLTIQNSSLMANVAAPGVGILMAGGGYTANLTVSGTSVTGFGTGLLLPSRGQNRVAGGYWDNQTNFQIPPQVSDVDSSRLVQFTGPIAFGPHTQLAFTLAGPQDPVTDPNTFFVPQQILLPDGRQLYYTAQAASYVPFPSTGPLTPVQLVGLTNQQLWSQYGLAIDGAVAPADAAAYLNGLAGSVQPFQDYYRLISPAQVSSGTGYRLQYQLVRLGTPVGSPVIDPTAVDLKPGWNVITRVINGATHSWLVKYQASAQLAAFTISGLSGPQLAGVPVTITVTALDSSGNVFAGYAGTVAFGTSDPRATLPASYTFTSADQGSHSFSLTFNTLGTQSLTVADASNPSAYGKQSGIPVSQPAPGPVLLKDTFAEANGTPIDKHTMDVGAGWNVLSGSWVIQNHQLNLTDTGAHVDAIVADAARSDVGVSLNFTTANQAATGNVGIVLRAQDNQNYWLVALRNNQLTIFLMRAGRLTAMTGPVTVPISPNAAYTMRAVASGPNITCFINGVEYLQYTGATFLQTATKHGIYSYRDPDGAQPLVNISSFECDTNTA